MKVKNLIKTLWYDKRVRFLFVGVLNTIVGYGVTIIVELILGIDVIHTDSTMEGYQTKLFVANLVGQLIGMIHSYFWNKYFTFRSKKKSVGEIGRFILVSAAQYGVNVGLEMLLTKAFLWSALAAKPVQIIASTLVSYLGNNFFSFRGQSADEESKKIAEEIRRKNAEESSTGEESAEISLIRNGSDEKEVSESAAEGEKGETDRLKNADGKDERKEKTDKISL